MLSADGVLDGEQRDRSQWHRGDNPGGPQGSRIGGPLRGISAMAFALRRWMLHTLHGHRHPGKFIHHRRSFPHQKGQRSSDTSLPRLRPLSFKFSISIAISLLFVSSFLFRFPTFAETPEAFVSHSARVTRVSILHEHDLSILSSLLSLLLYFFRYAEIFEASDRHTLDHHQRQHLFEEEFYLCPVVCPRTRHS